MRPIANKKDCKILQDWIKPVGNHVFYCSKNSKGDPELLIAMWKSLLHHVTNRHRFKSVKKYQQCPHKPYTAAESRRKKWLKKGSPAFEQLAKVVNDEKRLKDMPQLVDADHTGSVEVFHSILLSYASKRNAFDFATMEARTKLAIIDHNENINRNHGTIKKPRKNTGKKGEKKIKVVSSKLSGNWVPKPVKEEKTYDFIDILMQDIIAMKISGVKLKTKAKKNPNIPQNIARTPRPDKETILKNYHALGRF